MPKVSNNKETVRQSNLCTKSSGFILHSTFQIVFFPLLKLYDSKYVWEQISFPVISVKKLWMCAQS